MSHAVENEPTDQNKAEIDEDERELSRGEALYARLRSMITTLANRQSEVLRMSEYFSERESEVNDTKRRARRRIEHELQHVDESILDEYLALFESISLEEHLPADESAERDREFSERLKSIGQSLPEGTDLAYIDAIIASFRRSVGASYLHSSLLMILVGELEMFINYLARACFEVHPAALDKSGRKLTWSEITVHESVEDIRDSIVDGAVEDLLRGSLVEWVTFFETTFGIQEITAARSYEALEAMQRRHCIVHNGSLVSARYLKNLSEFEVDLSVDDRLDVDEAYLRRAADTMMLVAYSLTWALGTKLNPEPEMSEAVVGFLCNRTMKFLQEGRHKLVRQIGESALKTFKPRNEQQESTAFILQVNTWIAHKESGSFDSVRKAVAEFPVSTRSDEYKLAKAALLDQNELATEVAERMLRDNTLHISDILTWPLLRSIRDIAGHNRPANLLEVAAATIDSGATNTLQD